MRFAEPVQKGHFLRRYKRFFADVLVDGQGQVVHVPNTGSLKSCLFANAECAVTMSSDPKRKLKGTLQFLQTPTSWVGVNTNLPNQLVRELWQSGQVADWQDFTVIRSEYKISAQTRLDLVLAKSEADLAAQQSLCFIEVKNVTLADGATALFPDAVTSRGLKHLHELVALRERGHRAEMVFVVQREDCLHFAPADDIDPEYGHALRRAHEAGVVIRAFGCHIDPKSGVELNPKPMELHL